MKKAVIYLCIAIFLALVIQPNLNVSLRYGSSRVPTNTNGTPTTNENIDIKKCKSKATICIDPTYGGDDAGYTSDDTTPEKELVLDLSQAIGSQLSNAGYKVVYTREDNDTTLSDSERLEIAEKNDADYILSISLNHDSNPFVKGYSIFTQNDDQMIELAGDLSDELNSISYSQFLGADSDHYDNFAILDSSTPAILIDLGYITNADDYKKMTDESYQQTIAKAITKAFVKAVN
ncbi:N-acetylmuramoyl-L-alanine amidase family protein [Catenisphaera adipataccumulans]|jgi:N-acetylmuramoyl-L-alanine amidase|uniref:N-acetylmuramoyl-L-alanine amidase n=1 Tax=Catenisphaera adipataccumulans TaxID=700500 RepID=A0A7W8CX80_9FIRM|nr:N-acetylmuramoyl-L-alanine amidase [Catenisphaera adipataccumulans]MBB5183282.1 N-acetylmuramoyl-L-alanine amidase [Catenisphaera adipataccumulans]